MNPTGTQIYEQDFYAWIVANVEMIRQGKLAEIDGEHVAEELEAMGRRERRELINRLTVLLAHLLKWEFQPAQRSKSWRNTLTIQRSEIAELLEDSPSLYPEVEQHIDRAYGRARLVAEDETGLAEATFPADCPYSFEQILDAEFFPQ
jgi:hypothetical protein